MSDTPRTNGMAIFVGYPLDAYFVELIKVQPLERELTAKIGENNILLGQLQTSSEETAAAQSRIAELEESVAVLKSKVENSDVNLEQVRLIYKGKIAPLTASNAAMTKETDGWEALSNAIEKDQLSTALATIEKLKGILKTIIDGAEHFRSVGISRGPASDYWIEWQTDVINAKLFLSTLLNPTDERTKE